MLKNNKGADLLKQIRKKLGVTQTELAALLDMDRSYLSQIENGKREPSLKLLRTFERYWESVEKTSFSDEKTGKQVFLEGLRNAGAVGEEDPAVYGDVIEQIRNYMNEALMAAEKADQPTKGWVLHQLRTELPISTILKGELETARQEVLKAAEDAPLKKESTYRSSRIPGSGLSLTENPEYQEKIPYQPGGIRPEGPAVGPPAQSDDAETASGE